MRRYRIGSIFPMGTTIIDRKTVQFVTENTGEETVLILYEKKTGRQEIIELSEDFRIGNLFSLVIEGIDPSSYTYNYRVGGCEVTDLYARSILGNEVWGSPKERVSAGIGMSRFDWEDDRPLLTPYAETVIYQLHVRGFTRHSSSGVKKKGTVEGLVEKIPHLKDLGVTAVELLPAYEFLEMDPVRSDKLNYWGFKEAWYFAPKASYCGGRNPQLSFKTMVKSLHEAGIEVLMQFYFPPETGRSYLQEVLRFWVQEYHVDGFHLLGVEIPINVLVSDPVLYNTKLIYETMDGVRIKEGKSGFVYRNLAVSNQAYLYAVRRFLKADEGSLGAAFQAVFATKPWDQVTYLTAYNTFTLQDLVSYDRKHNEDNGEDGRDGCSDNASWNCGAEGVTRKKAILSLRRKQLRNAMLLLLFSSSVPMILAGDEFGNSQKGNNNPYCQDNEITWLNWRDLKKQEDYFSYVKKLLLLRKEYASLLTTVTLERKKTNQLYPPLSFHGQEAWRLDWENNREAGGVLFSGESRYLYWGINMHWEEAELALPNLQSAGEWELLLDTSLDNMINRTKDGRALLLKPRSMIILSAEGMISDENLSTF